MQFCSASVLFLFVIRRSRLCASVRVRVFLLCNLSTHIYYSVRLYSREGVFSGAVRVVSLGRSAAWILDGLVCVYVLLVPVKPASVLST